MADEVRSAAQGRTVVGIWAATGQWPASSPTLRGANVDTVDGLGLLPTTVTFGVDKRLALTDGSWDGHPVRGYEVHHRIATVDGGGKQFLDRCRAGSVWGRPGTAPSRTMDSDALSWHAQR